MIKCETCGSTFILGTLFCTECGAELYEVEHSSTAKQWSHAHFLILDNGRKQKLPLSGSDPIMIGRADADAGYWPQLDLSDDGGVEKGVSRQHAIVQSTLSKAILIDQGSANGTWIDNVKLEPNQPYPLPVSGRLRFGRLNVHIFLE